MEFSAGSNGATTYDLSWNAQNGEGSRDEYFGWARSPRFYISGVLANGEVVDDFDLSKFIAEKYAAVFFIHLISPLFARRRSSRLPTEPRYLPLSAVRL